MKPSDLRRDAYMWEQIAGSADKRASEAQGQEATTAQRLSSEFTRASIAIATAVGLMATLADELEAQE